MKINEHDAGHMTKMAAIPLFDKKKKTPQNPLLRNRWTDFHETWYVASETPAHHSLIKWWPWVDLDLFKGKVKFGNKGFSIGKKNENWISQKLLKPVTWELVDADNL